ncbi:MAG: lysophospholipase [Gammaproteobacteria bacterium]|nr:lysophospholipase [Gammaproteobacteria bacterium]MBU3997874.1 lysophospholipase [Gammaproteobacteria bacterium]MBU4079322.1 lysophospholipase [Gammaproteobacteria bacterium]MBU4113216.1 lysophospholipase [Gammaproteobacteria bacterium]MBU4171250.1 lysophospholipase [Gammaproteobacteria bacterium]
MTDSTLSTFVALDGDNLAVQDWPLAPGVALRGVVLLVHGLGEHVGRYDKLAGQLNDWGFAVRGYDQYGHGESGGPRGGLSSDTRLLDDLADIVDSTRARMAPHTPLILLGHSMGGLVAARFVALGVRPVQALVLSSPALDPGLNAVQKLLLAVLPKMAPNFRIGNGLNSSLISHDPAVVAAYGADKLVHDRISARLARFIADGGPATVAQAPTWSIPTLLLYAGADRLVNPAGSRAFAAAAPKAVLESHCFEGLYHEIFNESELEAKAVFAALKQWLDVRF